MNRGFTLIELSIVLIIIGLLVGGVLVGRDLIESAEMQAQVSQIREYSAAKNTFELKYDGLPGDLDNGVAYGLQSANGTGDGKVYTEGSFDAFDTEMGMHWEALGNSGLIDFRIDSGNREAPGIRLDKSLKMGAIYSHALGKHFWTVGVETGASGSQAVGEAWSGGANLTAERASHLDRIMDDGAPYTGTIVLAPALIVWADTTTAQDGEADTYFLGSSSDADTDCVSNDGTFDPTSGATYDIADTSNAGCPVVYLW